MFFLFLPILILNLLAIMIPKKLTMFENYTTILFRLSSQAQQTYF